MTTVSHTFVGAAIGSVIASANPEFDLLQRSTLILLCVFLSNFPDINLLWHRSLKTHHRDVTHFPIFTLAVTAIVFLMELSMLPAGGYIFTKCVFLSLSAHLLMDTFGNTVGVHWLYPFSMREFSFTSLRKEVLDESLKKRLIASVSGKVALAELTALTVSGIVLLG
jgi:hypothetical protein